ncbi:uncharacterized protein LOC143975842 [Lithobates pipiens]
MDSKKGMFQWDLGMEERDSSSAVLPANWLDLEPELRRERELYAELEFKTLASLVQKDQESSKQGAKMAKWTCLRTKKRAEISFRCCLNMGNVVMIIVLLTVIISLLLLYLHISNQQRDIKQKAEELRTNQSQCQEELADQQKMNMNLQSNITFLIQDNKSRQELMMSQFQQTQEHYVQNTERMKQSCQQLYKNYSKLQETYTYLWSSYVFLHRDSAILHNCHQRNPSDEGVVCPFCQSDWQFFGVSCYLLSPSATTWQESAHWCRMQGGHLAVVRNLKEQYFLQDLVKETSWIGLSDRDLEGHWRWVDETPYDKSAKISKSYYH